MEHVHLSDNKSHNKRANAIQLNDTKILQIIHRSKKLLIDITQKEPLLIDQKKSKNPTKTEFFKTVKRQRRKLNRKLKFLATKIYDQQLENLTMYLQESHQKIQSAQTIQEEVSLCLNEHNHFLHIYLTMIKISQQAQQLAEYGLAANKLTLFSTKSYPTYESIKNKSFNFFLTIKNNNTQFIDILTPLIECVTNERNQLLAAKLLLNDQQRREHYQIAKKRFTQTI